MTKPSNSVEKTHDRGKNGRNFNTRVSWTVLLVPGSNCMTPVRVSAELAYELMDEVHGIRWQQRHQSQWRSRLYHLIRRTCNARLNVQPNKLE